ncbi:MULTISPECIES: hypothetical protein [Streptomyces]|uniref:Uncharacterized protein n=1 Tax=Streptomyces ramulosus TaxID=47762 RepID=A0ABW1FC26_9ACTN
MPQQTALHTNLQRFNHSGVVQDFTVPPGVTTINARCWGGGGKGSRGGGGGFVTGDIAVQPGETLQVVVDLGGGSKGGGGMSGLFSQRLGRPLLIAGGGGGGYSVNIRDAHGGPGGSATGADGQAGTAAASGILARGASDASGGANASVDSRRGGRGGNTGQDGFSNASGTGGGQVPIPGMGGGGGAGDGGLTGGGAGYAGGGGGVDAGFPTRWASGGGGGSSFVDGSVAGGRSVPGTGPQAGGRNDALYESPVGDADQRGQVVLQWTGFTVAPGGPPDVDLVQGGPVKYPGVQVDGNAAVNPVPVTVELPAGHGLLFGTQTLPDLQLTVHHLSRGTVQYVGALSADGSSLAFSDVDLMLPGPTVMWVGVSATASAVPGDTALRFTVGGQTSDSTPVHVGTAVVVPPLSVEPGGPPDVLLTRGGITRYPAVKVTNNGTGAVPPLTVTVTLPPGAGLQWGQPGLPDIQLTVLNDPGPPYTGTLSPDGQSLTFTNVAPPSPGSDYVLYVGVSAVASAPLGISSLTFNVGGHQSASTPVEVTV